MSSTVAKGQRAAAAPNRQGILVIGVVIILVVVVAVVAILLSGGQTTDIDYASLDQTRTADGAFVIGDPNAPVTLVEFADFGCPHCQSYHQSTIEPYIENYVVTGKAKFEYRVFPTAGGQLSYFTGQLLECAEAQTPGAFWQGYKLMYDYAFSGRYNQDVGRLFASDLGLSYSELLTCSSDAEQVQTDINFAQQNGVTGTPAVLIRYGNGAPQVIPGYDRGGAPYGVLAQVTDAAQS